MRFEGPVLVQPDAGRVDADATVSALQRRAAAHGATVRFEDPVSTIEPSGDGVVVRSEGGEYRAPVAVVACGAWAPPHVQLSRSGA